MSLYKRGEIWWIYVRHGGRRTRRSTGTSDRAEAQRQHDELAASLWQIKAHGKRLSDALLAWHDARPRADSATRALKQIRSEYPDRPLSQVTEASLIETWGGRAPGTYNKLAAIIRAAMTIAHRNRWVDAVPRIARRREPIVEPRWLTAEQWAKLHAELPPHLKPMAAFAVATGLRWANVSGLTWDRVSLERKLAWIPASTAKAGRTIPVPLSSDALRALRAAGGSGEGFVFTYCGRRIGSAKKGWGSATERAGVPGFHWHDLRHTWASWHAMRGTPLDVLQKLGGWETRSMVERYAHLAPSYVASYAGNARPVAATKKATPRKKKAAPPR